MCCGWKPDGRGWIYREVAMKGVNCLEFGVELVSILPTTSDEILARAVRGQRMGSKMDMIVNPYSGLPGNGRLQNIEGLWPPPHTTRSMSTSVTRFTSYMVSCEPDTVRAQAHRERHCPPREGTPRGRPCLICLHLERGKDMSAKPPERFKGSAVGNAMQLIASFGPR